MDTKDMTIGAEDIARLRALRDELGIPGCAERVGISRDSLLRILAGSPVRRGTLSILRQYLALETSKDKGV